MNKTKQRKEQLIERLGYLEEIKVLIESWVWRSREENIFFPFDQKDFTVMILEKDERDLVWGQRRREFLGRLFVHLVVLVVGIAFFAVFVKDFKVFFESISIEFRFLVVGCLLSSSLLNLFGDWISSMYYPFDNVFREFNSDLDKLDSCAISLGVSIDSKLREVSTKKEFLTLMEKILREQLASIHEKMVKDPDDEEVVERRRKVQDFFQILRKFGLEEESWKKYWPQESQQKKASS